MTAAKTLRACGALFRVRMAEGLQYRAAALSGMTISVFWALIECTVYSVFYRYGGGLVNTNGMTLPMTMSYMWLAQGLWLLQFMSIDGDILRKITNGDVGVELIRPIDLYWHWFAKSAAGKLGTGWMRSLLTLGVGLCVPAAIRLGPPASPAGLVLAAVSAGAAFLLCSSFGMLVTAIRLNITWGDGPTYMLMLLSGVLSGGYLPLRLWPDALQTFLRWQPFGGFADIPIQLYLGTTPVDGALPRIGLQLAWTAVFIGLGRLVMRRRLRTVIVQGG